MIELLVKKLVDIDVQEESGRIALMLASISGHFEAADCLLQLHVDPYYVSIQWISTTFVSSFEPTR